MLRHAHTVADLRLSPDAVAMAQQLAEPDGRVVFDRHPLSNEPLRWGVSRGHDEQPGGLFAVEPYRQLLAYGLAEVAPCQPPYMVRDDWEGTWTAHPWSIVLTDRGRAWVDDGCRRDIEPPASGQRRRAA